jgi:hypothetical protein
MAIQAGATHSIALQFLTVSGPGVPTGSIELPASGDDVFYTFTPAAAGEMTITAGGQWIWSQSEDLSGVLTISTYSESLAHKRLGDIVASFLGGKQGAAFTFTGKRIDNGDIFVGQGGYITQMPDIVASKTAQIVTWTVAIGSAQKQYGRAIPDGV